MEKQGQTTVFVFIDIAGQESWSVPYCEVRAHYARGGSLSQRRTPFGAQRKANRRPKAGEAGCRASELSDMLGMAANQIRGQQDS